MMILGSLCIIILLLSHQLLIVAGNCECGKSSDVNQYINETAIGSNQFPWVVAVDVSETKGQIRSQCLGVLVSPNYVLTQGNCSGPLTNSTEVLITIRTTAKNQSYPLSNPSYLARSHFGLIKLDKSLPEVPICLPKTKVSYLNGEKAIYIKSGFLQTVVDIHRMHDVENQSSHLSDHHGFRGYFNGSPLMYDDNGHWTLIGIADSEETIAVTSAGELFSEALQANIDELQMLNNGKNFDLDDFKKDVTSCEPVVNNRV